MVGKSGFSCVGKDNGECELLLNGALEEKKWREWREICLLKIWKAQNSSSVWVWRLLLDPSLDFNLAVP